ncbi:hypothetical protein OK074_4218 [Actinobacteria bacterium OK074]|nr:hypothetical protein OK074_4218 [Actinobacteria bacterium OK074]
MRATIAADAVARLLSRPAPDNRETLDLLFAGLRRVLVREAVGEQVYDDLEAVLGEYARPGPYEVSVAVAARLREVAATLVEEVVAYVVEPYPVGAVERLTAVCAEQPCARDARGHLVRLALAVLEILDLLGDDVL